MSDQEDPAATSSPLHTKPTESYQHSTTFRQEPPFTNEDDRETIESYYSYLKDEAARVPPTQVLHHLETKVPLNHKCEFNELFTYFRSKQTTNIINWEIYEECVNYILSTIPIPELIPYLKTKQKSLPQQKSRQIKPLVQFVSSYQITYPERDLPYWQLFRFFHLEFNTASFMVLHQERFNDLLRHITENCALKEAPSTLWKEYSAKLFMFNAAETRCEPLTTTDPISRPTTELKSKFNGKNNFRSDKAKASNQQNKQDYTDQLADKLAHLAINKASDKRKHLPKGTCYFCGGQDHVTAGCDFVQLYCKQKIISRSNNRICDLNGTPLRFESIPFVTSKRFLDLQKSNMNISTSSSAVNTVTSSADTADSLTASDILTIQEFYVNSAAKARSEPPLHPKLHSNIRTDQKVTKPTASKPQRLGENLAKRMIEQMDTSEDAPVESFSKPEIPVKAYEPPIQVPEAPVPSYSDPSPRFRNYSDLALTDAQEDELIALLLSQTHEIPLQTLLGMNLTFLRKFVDTIKSRRHQTQGPPAPTTSNAVIEELSHSSYPETSQTPTVIPYEDLSPENRKLLDCSWHSGPLIYLSVQINSITLNNVLVDSGSKINVMSVH